MFIEIISAAHDADLPTPRLFRIDSIITIAPISQKNEFFNDGRELKTYFEVSEGRYYHVYYTPDFYTDIFKLLNTKSLILANFPNSPPIKPQKPEGV